MHNPQDRGDHDLQSTIEEEVGKGGVMNVTILGVRHQPEMNTAER